MVWTPPAAAGFGQAASAAIPLRPQQWVVATVSAAIFLYCASTTLGYAFYLFHSMGSLSSMGVRLVSYLLMAILGGWGVLFGLPDRKVAFTVLEGGVLLQSAISFMGMVLLARQVTVVEWFVVGGVSAALLWRLWKSEPIGAGDTERLNVALTVLLAAEVAAACVSISMHPSLLRSPFLFGEAVGIAALVLLRIKLPTAIGQAAAGPVAWNGPQAAGGFNPRLRRVLMILVYIAISLVVRVILRQAFR